jgi:hypothetical protein
MCGLVALVGDVPAVVRGAATRGAGARGPHSWGVAGWATSTGTWRSGYWKGRLVRVPVGPGVTVAHSRLATSTRQPGDAPDPAEGQPFVDGRLMVAHNGTLTPAEQDRWPSVPDSRSLLEGLRAGVSPGERLGDTRAPQAALWSDGLALWAGRWDGGGVPAHPLWIGRRRPGHGGLLMDGWLAVSSGYFPGAVMLAAGEATCLGELSELALRQG